MEKKQHRIEMKARKMADKVKEMANGRKLDYNAVLADARIYYSNRPAFDFFARENHLAFDLYQRYTRWL